MSEEQLNIAEQKVDEASTSIVCLTGKIHISDNTQQDDKFLGCVINSEVMLQNLNLMIENSKDGVSVSSEDAMSDGSNSPTVANTSGEVILDGSMADSVPNMATNPESQINSNYQSNNIVLLNAGQGLLAYYEICIKLVSPTNPKAPSGLSCENCNTDEFLLHTGMLRRMADPEKKLGSYGFRLYDKKTGDDGLWVGFEDPESAANKAVWAKQRGLGGVAVLDLGLDDPRGICDGNKFPITTAAKRNLDTGIPFGAPVPSYPAINQFATPALPAFHTHNNSQITYFDPIKGNFRKV